jgi:hypothetical protein
VGLVEKTCCGKEDSVVDKAKDKIFGRMKKDEQENQKFLPSFWKLTINVLV